MTSFLFAVFAVAFFLFVSRHLLQQWKREVNTDFAAALRRLNIEQYELLADKVCSPSRQKTGEVHRILRSLDDQYFVYFYTPGSPGVMQPITKERALLAVKLNG